MVCTWRLAMNKQKVKKKKEREERLRKEKHFAVTRSLYPNFVFVNEQVCSPTYVSLVKKIVQSINFQKFEFSHENAHVLDLFLKNIKKYGYKQAFGVASKNLDFMQRLSGLSTKDIEIILSRGGIDVDDYYERGCAFAKKHSQFIIELGNNIVNGVNKDEFMRYYPEQGFRICFYRNEICIVFQRLYLEQFEYKTFYRYMVPNYIKHKKRTMQIYFTKHSIERLLQRFSKNASDNYFMYILLYEFFQKSKYRIEYFCNRKPFIQAFCPCINSHENAARDIVAESSKYFNTQGQEITEIDNKDVYIKCFSSPVEFLDDKVFIITALLPGYHPTPEANVLNQPTIHNMRKRDKIRHIYFSEVDWYSEDYIEAFRFFHEAGINQIFLEDEQEFGNPFGIQNYYEKKEQMPDFLVDQQKN